MKKRILTGALGIALGLIAVFPVSAAETEQEEEVLTKFYDA